MGPLDRPDDEERRSFGRGLLGRRDDEQAIALVSSQLLQGRFKEALGYLKQAGADVVAAAFIVDLPDLGGSAKLRERGVKFHTLVEFEGE